MRRRSTPPAMSLFPFLDTLVCTMGALILMLLAMTPKIKERAQARLQAQMAALAPMQQDDPLPELQPVPEPEPEPAPESVAIAAAPSRAQIEEERAAERKRRRETWLKAAAEARETLAVKQADYRKRRQLLKETDQRLKDLEDQILKSQLKAESVDKADQSLADIATRLEEQQEHVAQEIARTRKNIDVLNRRQASAKNEYSLVPYDGTSGTVRRPIYIECTGKGFRFLPEDETVSPTDLQAFSDNYNPLLTGAQTLVKFWARRRRNSPESEPEPYVLLLVRPSGCFNYYLARQFLSSLSVNFGYELIEEDWKLSIPDPDPIAKSLLKETLDTTVQTGRPSRNSFADAGFGSGDSFDGGQFARGVRPNHFGPDDDGSSGTTGSGNGSGRGTGRGLGRQPSVKFGPATRSGRNAPDGPAGDDPLADRGGGHGTATGREIGAGGKTHVGGSDGSGRGTGGARAAGMNGGSRAGSGQGAGDSDGDGNMFASRAESGTASRGSARGARGGSGMASGDSIGDIGSLLPDDQASGTGINSGIGAEGDGGKNAAASLFGGPGRGGRHGRAGGASPATLGGSASGFDGRGSGDGGSGDGDVPLELMPENSPDNSFSGDGSGGTGGSGFNPKLRPLSSNSRSSTGQNPFDLSGGGPNSEDGATSGSSRSGSPSGTPASSGSNSSNASASDSSGASGSSQGGPRSANSSAGGSASSVQFGGPGANFSLGGGKKAKPPPKDDDPDSGPRISEDDGKPGVRSYRSSGPRKWGQTGKKATIGLERKIEIRLSSNKFLVGSKDVAVPVNPSDSDDEIVHRVVNAIDYVADKWGEPQEGCYWVPAVRFVVYPGGNQYSEKLSHVLEHKYGVHSTIDFAPDQPVKKTTPRGRP